MPNNNNNKTIAPKKIFISPPASPKPEQKSDFAPFPVSIGEPFNLLSSDISRPATPYYLTSNQTTFPNSITDSSSSSAIQKDGNSTYVLNFFPRPMVSPRPGDHPSLFVNNNFTHSNTGLEEANGINSGKNKRGCCGLC